MTVYLKFEDLAVRESGAATPDDLFGGDPIDLAHEFGADVIWFTDEATAAAFGEADQRLFDPPSRDDTGHDVSCPCYDCG